MTQDSSFNVPFTFGGIEKELSSFKKSKAVILPVPLEKTTSYGRGTEHGPFAIVDASRHMELYDGEFDCEPYKIGIHTDISLMKSSFSLKDMSESLKIIEGAVLRNLKAQKFVVSLGGEHSITIGILSAYRRIFGDDFTVIQFDAHADLRDKYEGDPLSHACVMRRIAENLPLVQIGIRSLSANEAAFARKNRSKIHYAGEAIDSSFLKKVLSEIKTDKIYITFDMDFLDPSVMPSVGTPEPGGYGYYDALKLIRHLTGNRDLIGIDFNELNPSAGITHPDFLCAKLIYKTVAYKFFNSTKKT